MSIQDGSPPTAEAASAPKMPAADPLSANGMPLNPSPNPLAPPLVEKATVAKQSGDGLDASKLSIGELLSNLKKLTVSSFVGVLTVVGTLLSIAWSAGIFYQKRFAASEDTQADTKMKPIMISGIMNVREGFSNEDVKNFVNKGKSMVRIVVPWFIDPIATRDGLDEVLSRKDATVEIYFLAPESRHLIERGRVAKPGASADYGPRMSMERLASFGP